MLLQTHNAEGLPACFKPVSAEKRYATIDYIRRSVDQGRVELDAELQQIRDELRLRFVDLISRYR